MNRRNPSILASTIAFPSAQSMTPLLEAGVGLEVFLDMPHWYDEVAVEETLTALRDAYGDFPLSFHASMAEELDLRDAIGSPAQQRALAAFRRTIGLAGRLGALHVVIHTHNHRLAPDDARPIYQKRVKMALPSLGEWAAQANTKVVVENIGTEPLGTLLFREQEYLDLFEEIPAIHSLIDIGHAYLTGWNIPALIRRLDGRLAGLHIHDNNGHNDDHLPVGQGGIAWLEVAGAVADLAVPPALVLEYERKGGQNTLASLLEDAKMIKTWWRADRLQNAG